VLVGENPSSRLYVDLKGKACDKASIAHTDIVLPQSVSQRELDRTLAAFNGDEEVSGISVQLPLPPHLSEQRTLNMIDPSKDVDGLTNRNIARTLSH
jgi:methylenetetrahydrofolate dehydrogenase (NADP+)/methenyltetrahydrofolate cyclohydrolase